MLSAHSDRMFFWLVVTSIVTGIGVILETPGELHELTKWMKLRRLKKPVGWGALVSFVGLVVVIGGIMGEGIFEYLSSNAETAIRAHDEQILADAIEKAGTAKDSAAAAATAAGKATDSANAAGVAAGRAGLIAKGARHEADSLTQEIVEAKQQSADASSKAVDAVSRLTVAENNLADATQRELAAEVEVNRLKTPRSLSNIDNLTKALKPFSGTEYTLMTFADQESINLTKEIGDTLEAAGWIRKEPTIHSIGGVAYFNVFSDKSDESVPSCIEVGVNVHVFSKVPVEILRVTLIPNLPREVQAAAALRAALISSIAPSDESNVGNGLEVDKDKNLTMGNGPVIVCVGKKP